jgi:hypothetical protein
MIDIGLELCTGADSARVGQRFVTPIGLEPENSCRTYGAAAIEMLLRRVLLLSVASAIALSPSAFAMM